MLEDIIDLDFDVSWHMSETATADAMPRGLDAHFDRIEFGTLTLSSSANLGVQIIFRYFKMADFFFITETV